MIFFMVSIWQLDFYFLSKVVISVCVPFGVSHSFPHNKVMYKESKTQEKKCKFPCLLKLRRPVKMQEGTLLKENTKGRNSNFFLNQGWFEFSNFFLN